MMMKKAKRGIAAIAIALVALLSPCETLCQHLDVEHRQIHYNERKRLVTKFNDLQEKAQKAWDKGKYDEAVAYLKKCKELNDNFGKEICDECELNKTIQECEDFINQLKKTQDEAKKKEKAEEIRKKKERAKRYRDQ